MIGFRNRENIDMTKAPPVEEQPEIHLEQWVLCRIGPDMYGHSRYSLAGIPVETSRMRMTTFLVSFDPDEKTAVTESGRVYRLVGDNAITRPHPDTEIMIRQWCRGHGFPFEAVSIVPTRELDNVPAPVAPSAPWRH
jgi:hypothetical protein